MGLNYPSSDQPDLSDAASRYEGSCWRSADLALLVGLTQGPLREALISMHHRCFGPDGDPHHEIHHPADAFWVLRNLSPHPTAPQEPLPVLSPALQQGFIHGKPGLAGDLQWALQANLNPTPGIYSFQDTGSLRLLSHGVHWVGQASRVDRHWPTISRELESTVILPGFNPWGGGKVQVCEGPHSCTVKIDGSSLLSQGHTLKELSTPEGSWTREWTVSSKPGALFFATLRDVTSSENAIWQIHTEAQVEVEATEAILEGGGCRLLLNGSHAFHVEPGPNSSRLWVEGWKNLTITFELVEDPHD